MKHASSEERRRREQAHRSQGLTSTSAFSPESSSGRSPASNRAAFNFRRRLSLLGSHDLFRSFKTEDHINDECRQAPTLPTLNLPASMSRRESQLGSVVSAPAALRRPKQQGARPLSDKIFQRHRKHPMKSNPRRKKVPNLTNPSSTVNPIKCSQPKDELKWDSMGFDNIVWPQAAAKKSQTPSKRTKKFPSEVEFEFSDDFDLSSVIRPKGDDRPLAFRRSSSWSQSTRGRELARSSGGTHERRSSKRSASASTTNSQGFEKARPEKTRDRGRSTSVTRQERGRGRLSSSVSLCSLSISQSSLYNDRVPEKSLHVPSKGQEQSKSSFKVQQAASLTNAKSRRRSSSARSRNSHGKSRELQNSLSETLGERRSRPYLSSNVSRTSSLNSARPATLVKKSSRRPLSATLEDRSCSSISLTSKTSLSTTQSSITRDGQPPVTGRGRDRRRSGSARPGARQRSRSSASRRSLSLSRPSERPQHSHGSWPNLSPNAQRAREIYERWQNLAAKAPGLECASTCMDI